MKCPKKAKCYEFKINNHVKQTSPKGAIAIIQGKAL